MSGFKAGVDVVVVNYKTPRLLIDFIDSYKYQFGSVDSDLYIIDVLPEDDQIVNYLSDMELPYWYMPFDWNIGYAGACNFAATVGDREVVAFFNSDTRLFDDTLSLCHEALVDNEKWAVVGPLQVNSSGCVTHAGVFGDSEYPVIRGWLSRTPDKFRDIRDDAVTVFGSAYFVKRSIWNELANDKQFKNLFPDCDGAFLPTPHYYEETWFSYFARHKGYNVVYYGPAMMLHEWQKSPVTTSEKQEFMRKSRKIFREACDAIGIARD